MTAILYLQVGFAQAAQIQVQIVAFSGRPNPQFVLSEDSNPLLHATILQLFDTLGSQVTAIEPPQSNDRFTGYQGIRFTLQSTEPNREHQLRSFLIKHNSIWINAPNGAFSVSPPPALERDVFIQARKLGLIDRHVHRILLYGIQ